MGSPASGQFLSGRGLARVRGVGLVDRAGAPSFRKQRDSDPPVDRRRAASGRRWPPQGRGGRADRATTVWRSTARHKTGFMSRAHCKRESYSQADRRARDQRCSCAQYQFDLGLGAGRSGVNPATTWRLECAMRAASKVRCNAPRIQVLSFGENGSGGRQRLLLPPAGLHPRPCLIL